MKTAAPLRLLWLPNIVNAPGPRSLTTELFLHYRHATVSGAPTDSGECSLYIANPRKTVEYFSHEADRFATAAFESMLRLETATEFNRSIAWPLVRAYYSAFFSLHALFRVHGWACTRLSANVVAGLNRQVAGIYPDAPRLQAGLYFIECRGGGTELGLKKMDAVNGGSHEALWSLLDGYIKLLTDTALTESSDPEAGALLTVAIGQFQEVLKKNGGAQWLTKIRNLVNYSHEFGAWFPYAGSTCDLNRINTCLKTWLLAPEAVFSECGADTLIQYTTACSFLVSLCRTTVEDLVFRSVARSPFRASSGRLATQLRQLGEAA